MFRIRSLAMLGAIALLGLAACSDVTGPGETGVCPLSGGPGTCTPGVQN